MLRLTVIFVLIGMYALGLEASAEEQWTVYTAEDGLVYDIVLDIAIDHNGTKWIATQWGVSSFDGLVWTTYQWGETLASNYTTAITIDTRNMVWISKGIESGHCIMSFDGEKWTTYTEDDGLVYKSVSALAVDADNVKWFGTVAGVSSFDGITWRKYFPWDHHGVNSIAVDHNNVKWFGTGGGLYSCYGSIWKHYPADDDIGSRMVFKIAVDNKNVKWAGFRDTSSGGGIGEYGIACFDGITWTPYVIGTVGAWSGKIISSIAIDANNIKWMGSLDKGLYSFDGTSMTNYTTDDGLPSNIVNSIAVDDDNVKWIGTARGVLKLFDKPGPERAPVPDTISITGNHPNPFNPATIIEFTLYNNSVASLDVYNIAGQLVKTLTTEYFQAGAHAVVWNGTDDAGVAVASGIYFCRLRVGGRTAVHRMVMVR